MNKTLLLIIVDFLFLNLIALTRWEKAEPVRARQPPVPAVAANAATKDQDLVEVMRQSLADEQAARTQLEKKLEASDSTLVAREQTLAGLQTEKTNLGVSLAESQKRAAELARQAAAASQDATMTKEQLAQLQRELEARRAEADRQKQALAQLEKDAAAARKQIEGLTVAVVVGEQEKQDLKRQADQLESRVQAERAERLRVEQSTNQLAQGVGQLAQNSGELSKEIRDNRPISSNILFNEFTDNRILTTLSVSRKGLFGDSTRIREHRTVFTTDGRQVYALIHVDDTPFSLYEPGIDWEKISVGFNHPPEPPSAGGSIDFLAADPRIAVIPVAAHQVAALGAKVYPIAADPFRFPEALLINGGGKGYGDVGFKLAPEHPGYVKVDNRLFKRLFGDFAPSRGDLVFSKGGEIIGVMVNADYCLLLKDFTPAASLTTGEDTSAEHTAGILDGLAARVRALPFDLQ